MRPTSKAFLIHGFLGVGKTTFAKRLEQEQHAVRFTHDEWMSALYGDDPPAEQFQLYADRVSKLMEETWTRCVALGTNIVLDFGFWSRQERARIHSLVRACGGEPVLYRLNCSDDIAWARIAERNKRLAGSLYIARNTFEVLKARFEPLHTDERRVEVDSRTAPRRPHRHGSGTASGSIRLVCDAYFSPAQKRWMRVQASSSVLRPVA